MKKMLEAFNDETQMITKQSGKKCKTKENP